jgi:hypothetical protein
MSVSISMAPKNFLATDTKASVGQAKNQSIVQQFTSEGNIRTLFWKASPIGEKANTILKLFLHLSTKYLYNYSGDPSPFPSFLASALTISISSPFSSGGNKLGTSQVLSKLLISSINDSYLI